METVSSDKNKKKHKETKKTKWNPVEYTTTVVSGMTATSREPLRIKLVMLVFSIFHNGEVLFPEDLGRLWGSEGWSVCTILFYWGFLFYFIWFQNGTVCRKREARRSTVCRNNMTTICQRIVEHSDLMSIFITTVSKSKHVVQKLCFLIVLKLWSWGSLCIFYDFPLIPNPSYITSQKE